MPLRLERGESEKLRDKFFTLDGDLASCYKKTMSQAQDEINRRRCFAIISHPDAGKTTITEKILFNSKVIREAGEVKGKAGRKAATSDWMKMEQQRGVSITSSVMQFDYNDLFINLIDTPGHKDFGEDTYRTLMATDSAAMLLDAAKGVERQTNKLFEVCHMRRLPIFTFANKMDRDGKEPLELIDDVERTLDLPCFPVTWPIGMGQRFKGLYHRLENRLYLYERGRESPIPVNVESYKDPQIRDFVGDELFNQLQEDLGLLEGTIGPFNQAEFMAGKLTPLTFGSAKYNWGVDIFLNLFTQFAPPPAARSSSAGMIEPVAGKFSGFVFKIQANMDRKHRDRVAFIRIISGVFERGMKVHHTRLNRPLRLSYASQFMAQQRETTDRAYAGDVVGITDTGYFQIGDTITEGKDFEFAPMPRFAPEVFATLSIKDPLKRKSLQKGLRQLSEEGTIQIFTDPLVGDQEAIVGAVGELQFDVLLFRLNDEYKLEVKLNKLGYQLARWPRHKKNSDTIKSLNGQIKIYQDNRNQPVLLLNKEWDLHWLRKENPDVEFFVTGNSDAIMVSG